MKNFISLFNSSVAVAAFAGLSFLSTGCASHKNEEAEHHHHHWMALKTAVELQSKSNSKTEGKLRLEEHEGGVIITGRITGLKPGLHGFHVHEKGDCSAADASSAGGHFHMAGQEHGAFGEKSSHFGDLGNIEADRDGIADVSIYAKGVTLTPGEENSIAGRSVVVHAKVDDLKSQPAGNSGARVACGVIPEPETKGKHAEAGCHCHDHD